MNEIIALQKYENEAQLAKELIRGFWLAHGDYVITDEEAAENLAAWTDKGHVFYFILKEEIPIGFVHLGSRGAEVDWIEDLFVLPEYQGNGYGSHAIALVEAEIKKYSESVYLEVAARNFGAMKLYHRLGYHCLNTVTLRKDFQPENFEVIRSEELWGIRWKLRSILSRISRRFAQQIQTSPPPASMSARKCVCVVWDCAPGHSPRRRRCTSGCPFFKQPQPPPSPVPPQSQTAPADAPDKTHKTDTSDSIPVFRYKNAPES